MQTKRTKIELLLALIMISLSCLFAQPAQATIRDQAIVGRLQDQRNVLLIKQRQLLEDYDDLQKRILDLQKRHDDPKSVDQLCRQADYKYDDLKSVEHNLRQLDMLLM